VSSVRHSVCVFFCLVVLATVTQAQERNLHDFPKKGSYLYYGQPAFEDNSFLLEEAFNQPMGVIQHIANVYWDDLRTNAMTCSFTQEIPLTHLNHQLSYTLNYAFLPSGTQSSTQSGFGDIAVSYRPLVYDAKDWAMVIPRFTVILPTGNASLGLGNGGVGFQFNMAMTKRLSRKVATHYNMGYSLYLQSKRFDDVGGKQVMTYSKNLPFANAGAGINWYFVRKASLMLEYLFNENSAIEETGGIDYMDQHVINPGLRYCIDNGRMQIVPGIGIPISFVDGNYEKTGLFIYLSLEPDYLSFYTEKSQ
jgi:hypothetical protein